MRNGPLRRRVALLGHWPPLSGRRPLARGCGRAVQVAEHEAVAGDDLAGLDGDGPLEHRPGAGEGVELAVLGARIDAGRQFGQQGGIEAPAGKARRQLRGIDAGDVGLEPAAIISRASAAVVDAPQREQRGDAGAGELVSR